MAEKKESKTGKKTRRVAEVIHIVPEEREEYLKRHLNPTQKLARIMWMHGMRNMQYYLFHDLIIMSFDYIGDDFYMDMALMQENKEIQEFLIQTRRRDVPREKRETTNWWAPMKKVGSYLKESPMPEDEMDQRILEDYYESVVNEYRKRVTVNNSALAYDAEEWQKKEEK